MITLSDAILAINPNAEFDYDDIDNIFWRRKTKPISKDEILQKYRELRDIEIEQAAIAKSNQLSIFGEIFQTANKHKGIFFKYRQDILIFTYMFITGKNNCLM